MFGGNGRPAKLFASTRITILFHTNIGPFFSSLCNCNFGPLEAQPWVIKNPILTDQFTSTLHKMRSLHNRPFYSYELSTLASEAEVNLVLIQTSFLFL